jgi:hypothetical protein
MMKVGPADVINAAMRGEVLSTSGPVDITPEVAALLIAANRGNRPTSMQRVRAYADAIAADAWDQMSWAMIQVGLHVDGDIVLVDGAHRCHAVAAAGKPIKALFVSIGHAPRGALGLVIDGGVSRTHAQIVGIDGGLASAASTIYRLSASHGAHGSCTPQQTGLIADRIKPIRDALLAHGCQMRGWANAGSMAGLVARCSESLRDEEYVVGQFHALVDAELGGNMTPRTAAALRLGTGSARTTSAGTAQWRSALYSFAVFDRRKSDAMRIFANIPSVEEAMELALRRIVLALA